MSQHAPLELAPQEDLDAYADTFGMDREMVRLARRCPECHEAILVPDNDVWLNAKPTPDGEWRIFKLGPFNMAGSGGEAEEGSKHTLHEHQPEESD